jgi:formate dehydrogenase iron-sulfur subunit
MSTETSPSAVLGESLDRRSFLRTSATVTGAAGLGTLLPTGAETRAVATAEELETEHAGDPALLIDLTRCIGCGSCVAACKLTNGLGWRSDQPALGPDAELASSDWSVVRTEDAPVEGGARYVKTQCMHCLEPACVSACFVKALTKSEAGPVVYDGEGCVGCRYCLLACPFGVPTFEWDQAFGRVQKCDLCAERTSQGRPTACEEACPTGAVSFGRRDQMIAEAHRRIVGGDAAYVDHVYGEHEVGGTSVLYLSDVPFEELGFRSGLPEEPIPSYTWEITRLLPPVAVGLGALLILLWRRRQDVLERQRLEEEQVTG